jgi:hypothetical protein
MGDVAAAEPIMVEQDSVNAPGHAMGSIGSGFLPEPSQFLARLKRQVQ